MTRSEQAITLDIAGVVLDADLTLPTAHSGLVAFAHGSGSSRGSPRNRYVAQQLVDAGLGTLLLDLLTPAEALSDERTGHLRFDITQLAERMVAVTDWLEAQLFVAGHA